MSTRIVSKNTASLTYPAAPEPAMRYHAVFRYSARAGKPLVETARRIETFARREQFKQCCRFFCIALGHFVDQIVIGCFL